jgi:hypothetical protein
MLPGPGVAATQKEAVLREIAFDFQIKHIEEDSLKNLEQLIASIAPRLGISIPAKDLLEDIETRSGLLTERSIGVFAFTHLTLQEYLVAKHIQLNRTYYSRLTANFDNRRWREVILLYTGLVDDATELIRGAASSGSPYRQRLAGYCIGDAERYNSEIAQEVIDKLLDEAANDQEEMDDLVNVIAAIAADFHSEPRSVKENLSARLISEITDESVPTTRRAFAITAIGRARITHALPVLLPLLGGNDAALSVAVFNAVVQFGDLALPAINQFVNRGTGITRPVEIIRVLGAINTGTAARMLVTMVERSPTYSPLIFEQMAKMIANPLVEADLLELETAELPPALRNQQVDNNGWPWNSAKSGFLVLDTLMRRRVRNVIDDYAKTPSLHESELTRTSFKVSFPAFRTYLKSFPEGLIPRWELFVALGFDKFDPNKLHYLIDRIKSQFHMPLEFALQRLTRTNESHLPDAPKREKFWNALSYACFFLVYLLLIINGTSAVVYISEFDFTRRTLTLRAMIFLSVHFLGLVACVAMIVVTKQKLKTPIRSRQFLSIIVNPIEGFLKVLPYVGKGRPTVKLIAFQLLIFFLTGHLLYLYVLWFDFPPWFVRLSATGILSITAPVFFVPLSIYYWKHRILARNPVLELVSMHPAGRKLVGDID